MAAPKYQTITDKQLKVKFQVPDTWVAGRTGSALEIHAPGNVAFLRVQEATTTATLASIAKGFAADELRTLRKTDAKATVTTRTARVTAGPAALVTMRYHGVWVGIGTDILRTIYFLKNGTRAYEFDFGTPNALAAKEAASFATAISSVRLL